MNYYSDKELEEMGIKFGNNVRISKKASLFSTQTMEFGNDVRIDDFCILSGNITIGNFVHISAYTALYGKYGIKIGNYCGCSPRCTLLSGSDDFSGEYMISPMVPDKYTNVDGKQIVLEDFSQIGANSIIMPGVTVNTGAVCGCFSFIKNDVEEWSINVGIPSKKIKDRSRNILEIVKRFEDGN